MNLADSIKGFFKARNITPESNTYNSFINEVASKLDKITLKEDSYECMTRKVKYNQK